jgi:hypothetical protein
MSKKIQDGERPVPRQGWGWLCLLLAITFLYNPFLATSSWLNGQSVSHLPSFRATLASSELLKFKPEEKSETAAVPDCDVQELVDFTPVVEATAFREPDTNKIVHARFLPTGSLFFRPPPAV